MNRRAKIAAQAFDLLKQFRESEPNAGVGPVCPDTRAGMLRSRGVTRCGERVPLPYLFVPDESGGAELYLGLASNDVLDEFVEWRALGLVTPGTRDPLAAAVAALCCVVHRQGRRSLSPHDPADPWDAYVLRQLASLPATWTEYSLASLLDLAEDVLCEEASRRLDAYTLARAAFRRGRRLRARGDRVMSAKSFTVSGDHSIAYGLHRCASRAFVAAAADLTAVGDFATAGALLQRALRLLERVARPRDLPARAHHEFLLLCIATGDWAGAESHAAAALEMYGPTHKNLLYLSADTALAFAGQGRFAAALPLFKAAAEMFERPEDRGLAFAAAARCSGALGDGRKYRLDCARSWAEMGRASTTQRAPDAFVWLGEGALWLSLWDAAELAFREAIRLADSTGDAEVARVAEINLAVAAGRGHPNAPAREACEGGEPLTRRLLTALNAA